MDSGLWGTIQRIALPILAKFRPQIRRTANRALSVLAGAASDALNQRSSFADSLKSRGKVQVQETLDDFMQQMGGKRGVKRRQRANIKTSRKRPPKKRKQSARFPW